MYTSFRVQKFRCFRDLRLNDLGRVNLIAGKNNSGKTALLEAMYIHSGNRDPKTLLRIKTLSRLEDFFLREIRGIANPSDIASWRSLFYDFSVEKKIKLFAEFDKKPKQLSNGESGFSLQISNVSPDREDFFDILREYSAEDDDNVEILEFNLDFDNKPFHLLLSKDRIRSSRSKSHNLIQSDFLYTREPIASDDNVERFSNMRQLNTTSGLIKVLKIIEPRLKGLEILYDAIHADVGLNQLISLTNLGDGMNRIASLILAMNEVSNGVVFIDEIENGLHHSTQTDMWKAIGRVAQESNIQVFATTHSLEMIRAAHEAFKDDDPYEFRLHRMDRDSVTDDIEAVTYNQFGMESLAAFDFDYEVRG